jgi:hypothetical protein
MSNITIDTIADKAPEGQAGAAAEKQVRIAFNVTEEFHWQASMEVARRRSSIRREALLALSERLGIPIHNEAIRSARSIPALQTEQTK